MLIDKKRKVYSEIDAFLDIIPESERNKIPNKLRIMFKEEKLHEYNPKYNTSKPIEKQNMQRETVAMIGLLHLNYWCKTEEEKQELRNIFVENENKYEQELREKHNPDNIFKNRKYNTENSKLNEIFEQVAMTEYKEPFCKKILNFIHRIFKKPY